MKSCIIFCGGDPVSKALFEATAPGGAYTIAADSGYLLCDSLGVCPQLIIGDFDSAAKPLHDNIITFPVEKDDTDLMLAIKEGLRLGFDDYYIYGATGGRLDHTYAAVQSLAYLLANGAFGRIIAENERIKILTPGRHEISAEPGFSLSLFAYGEPVDNVNVSGTKYTCEGSRLTDQFPLGVSNKILSDKAEISFSGGKLLVICSRL